MSYVVLARKYRPRSFAQMVGQEHVVQALGNALRQGRLHHAYLFTGTRGIGKTTVSRILAKSLNCTGPDGTGGITDRPCGVCQACTEIDADRYIDYIELDAASNRGIDEVRDLLERAAYKPSLGRFKVFMIDEAHQLTKESFNALLKTLEEPPEYLKFVLATTDPQKMLPTVLSRCLQFNLRPMAPETVREHLEHVLQAEQVAWDEGSLRLLSRAARGSMRDALSLTDQAIAYGGGRLDEAVVRTMLGTVDRSHAQRLVQALAARDGPGLLAGIDALRAAGLSAAGTLEEMASLLQNMAVAQAVPGALDASDPELAPAVALARELPSDETQLLYSMVLHGRQELTLASDEYAALTMVLLRLFAFEREAGAGAALPSEPVRTMAAPPAAAVVPPATPPAVPPAVPLHMGQTPRQSVAARAPIPSPASVDSSPGTGPAADPPPRHRATPSGRAGPDAVGSPVAARSPSSGVPPAGRGSSSSEPPPWLDAPVFDDEPRGSAADAVEGDLALLERPQAAVRPRPAQTVPPRIDPPAPLPADDAQAGAETTVPAWQVTRTALGDRWAAVVAQLQERGAIAALVRELAQQAELVRTTGADGCDAASPVWVLRVERETLRTTALKDKLQTALAAVLQPAPVLEVEAGIAVDSPARREVEHRERRQREAEDIIRNDPVVRELMSQFRTARIVAGSIKPT